MPALPPIDSTTKFVAKQRKGQIQCKGETVLGLRALQVLKHLLILDVAWIRELVNVGPRFRDIFVSVQVHHGTLQDVLERRDVVRTQKHTSKKRCILNTPYRLPWTLMQYPCIPSFEETTFNRKMFAHAMYMMKCGLLQASIKRQIFKLLAMLLLHSAAVHREK